MRISEDAFIATWKKLGGAQAVADHFGHSVRSVYNRRRAIEQRRGIKLIAEQAHNGKPNIFMPENGIRAHMEMENGTILVGSDCHYLPGEEASLAHQGFVEAASRLQPDMIMLNGDIFDFASISRHPRLNTRPTPTLAAEIQAVQTRVEEIEMASPGSTFYRTLGNHDARLEVRIANQAPEFTDLITLEQFLPNWLTSVSLFINGNLMFLHKFANGMHAAHNNVRKSGGTVSVVTGHTHRLGCKPFSHYSGTAFGIETGTLADPFSDAFEYCMDTPKDWQPGFAVITVKDGEVMYPEFAQALDGRVFFRGEDLLD